MAPAFDSVHLDSSGWQPLLKSGRNCLQNGDFTSAVSTFSSFLTKISGAPSLNFALVDGLIGKGIGLVGLDQYHEAIENFSKALTLADGSNYSRRVEILWRRGQAYEQSGLLTRAIADYTSAISENPKFCDAFMSRGVLLYRLSQYVQAISDFSFVIKFDERNCDAYMWRARCRLSFKSSPSYSDYINALQDCSIALSIDPNNAQCLLIRARSLLGLHQYPLAKEAYTASISIDPSLSDEELLQAVSRGVKRSSETELVHEDKRICSGPLHQHAAF